MFPRKLYRQVLLFSTCIATIICRTADAQTSAPQDTLQLSLQQTEQKFLENNLLLLAARYNVQADSALILQARLWDNPLLSTDQNIYSNHRWMEHGSNPDGSPKGQYLVQLEFLLKTAGKRGKQIRISQTSAAISEWQFRDLLLRLKSELRNNYYRLQRLELDRQLLEQQSTQTSLLLSGMSRQLASGNIARKDLLRIQALHTGLQQDILDNSKEQLDIQSELRSMLQLGPDTYIRTETPMTGFRMPQQSTQELSGLARQYNPGYQLQVLQLQWQQQNLSLQKAMAVPDISIVPNYDQNSNYTPRYWGLGINLPLPVFNRNQGNIKSARLQVREQETSLRYMDQQLDNDVVNAWQKLQLSARLAAEQAQDTFYRDYDALYQNIVSSYQARQISMMEFVDFFDAYKDMKERRAQLQLDLMLAAEELNYKVGTDLR